MNKIKVSACVITYNHEDFLRECLEGAVNQKVNFAYEIVVGQDNSTDQTHRICTEYKERYPDLIRYYPRERNLGMIGNWEETINQCEGKYIAMCEGDDYWTDPLKLQKQVDFLEANEDYVLTFHPVQILNPDGSLVDDFITKVPEKYETQETLASGNNYIHTPSVVFRNIITHFPPEFTLSPIGDYFLYMLLTAHGKMKIINDTMAVYRNGVGIHSGLNDAQKSIDWRKTLTLLISSSSNFQIKTILFEKLFPTLSFVPVTETKEITKLKNLILLFIPPVVFMIKNKIFKHK